MCSVTAISSSLLHGLRVEGGDCHSEAEKLHSLGEEEKQPFLTPVLNSFLSTATSDVPVGRTAFQSAVIPASPLSKASGSTHQGHPQKKKGPWV